MPSTLVNITSDTKDQIHIKITFGAQYVCVPVYTEQKEQGQPERLTYPYTHTHTQFKSTSNL